MTLEEAILARSVLPKNGTYTMTDHILAMAMSMAGGECISLELASVDQDVELAESKAELKVENNIISTEVDVSVTTIIVSQDSEEVEVYEC